MSDQIKMIALVSREAVAALPEYKVDVQASADDAFVLCVRVYGVPKAEVEQAETRVFDLEERLLPGTRYILLPMVKNLEVTREYYPEYMPLPPVSRMSPAMARELIDAVLCDQGQYVPYQGKVPDPHRPSPRANGEQRGTHDELALAA